MFSADLAPAAGGDAVLPLVIIMLVSLLRTISLLQNQQINRLIKPQSAFELFFHGGGLMINEMDEEVARTKINEPDYQSDNRQP